MSRPVQPHGTWSRYKQHRKDGEEACAECKAASARRSREQYAKNHEVDRGRGRPRKYVDEQLLGVPKIEGAKRSDTSDPVDVDPPAAVSQSAESGGEVWPPAADEATVWTIRSVRVERELVQVKLRGVRLWGREVLIDEAGRVFCRCCEGLVDVAVLGRAGNGHFVSPWPAHPFGTSISVDDADDDPSPVSFWDKGL